MKRLITMASRRMCTINTTQWTRNSSVPSDSMDPVNKPIYRREVLRKYREQLRNRVAPNMEYVPFENRYLEQNYVKMHLMKVETRILRILHESELVDIRKFKFNMDFRKDLQIDSLNLTVILTEIEHEFTTVFEDRIFEGVQRMEELVYLICRDEKAF